MRILLVDDDELLTQTLTHFLTAQHYAVDVAMDGEAGWNYAQAAAYDLIMLDINLPKLDGVRLCQKLRQNKCDSPILLLTAKGDSSDKVIGLDAGADDYLVKPCTPEELSARIRALLRRHQSLSTTPLLEWAGLCLDPGTCRVTYHGQLLSLSPKEYSLLELFLRNPQRVFSSSIILEHLWGFEDAPGEETVRTHIKRLRRKLKAVGAENLIDNVYGMGYRLKPLTNTVTATMQVAPIAALPTAPSTDAEATHEARAAAIALWEQFRPSILERMTSLDQAVVALKAGHLPDELRQAAAIDAHKLAGSLGMFGFPEGSRLGQELEQWFRIDPKSEEVDQLEALVAALHQELQPPAQDSEVWQTWQIPELLDVSLSLEETQSGQPRSLEMPSPDIKVLIVDDDPLILENLRQVLPRWGIQPITLDNPIELWDVLESEVPDLLILDVDMPPMNGIELCQMLRNDRTWNGLPILFLTAHREPEMVVQLYSAGADDYVAKPFTEPEVVTRIFNRLERNRLLRLWQKPSF